LFDKILLVVLELFLIWWTQDLLHFDDLDSLGVPWEHWGFGEQLKNDAACCPNID
jgi:hypothetical protein